MIPDYYYDYMNRQMPMTQMPMGAPMNYGYPMQGMYQQSNPGMYQQPVQGGMQMPMDMPMQGQMPMQSPFGGQFSPGQQMPQTPLGAPTAPVDFGMEPGPPVQTDVAYTQGWLRTQIGKRVKIEFLIGTNMLIDRDGTLLDVGISYVLINEAETDDVLMCDIYSIKFVRVYY